MSKEAQEALDKLTPESRWKVMAAAKIAAGRMMQKAGPPPAEVARKSAAKMAAEKRDSELRFLQAKATEIDERLHVEITGNDWSSNIFTVTFDTEDKESKVLGEGLTLSKTSGFLEGIEAGRSLACYPPAADYTEARRGDERGGPGYQQEQG